MSEPETIEPAPPKRSLRGALVRFALLAVVVAAGFAFLRWGPFADRFEPAAAVATLEAVAASPWAPLALLAAYVVLAPLGVPISPFFLAGGLVFGFGWGALLNFAGSWLAAVTTYAVGRLLGRDFFEHLLGSRLTLIENLVERHGFWTLVRLRLVPIPYFVVNYAAALAGVRPATFCGATALGLVPSALMLTWFAAALVDLAAHPENTGTTLAKLFAVFLGLLALTFLPRLFAGRKDGAN